MKYHYSVIIIIACFLMSVLMTGCDISRKKEEEPEQGSIVLYYLNAEEDGFEKAYYKLDNPDDPVLASYEVTYHLSDAESSSKDQYKSSIYDGVIVNSIVINEGVETIDFGSGYRQLSPVKEILCRAAVVNSLIQIEGVDSVRFTINGDSLLGTDGSAIGDMNEKTFLLEGDSDQLYDDSRTVTLYYSNEKGDGLIEYETTLDTQDNIPLETRVLEALKEVPEGVECLSPLPEGVKINQIQIHNNVCYVDLSQEIENILPGVEDKVTVYAMVNSVISIGSASSVQFTVNGKKMKNLHDFDSFHLLLTCDYSLSGKKETKTSEQSDENEQEETNISVIENEE